MASTQQFAVNQVVCHAADFAPVFEAVLMLIRTYIHSLLVDPELADSICEIWAAGLLSDGTALTLRSAIDTRKDGDEIELTRRCGFQRLMTC